MTRALTLTFIAAALCAGAACGKSEEEKQAEAAAKAVQEGAASMAEGAAAVAKGLEQMAQAGGSGKVEVVPFEVLGAALPEVSGWQRGDIQGTTTSFPMPMSQSEATYVKGDSRIEVQVVDTALNQLLFAPFSMYLAANYSERTSDGYRKGTSVKGEPGFEEVDTTQKTASVTVVVGKRFIVSARGTDVSGVDAARAVLEQMDFAKLSAAK